MGREHGPRLRSFPVSVLRDLCRTRGTGGWGSWGPAITVSGAACAVGWAGATAQWRVLVEQMIAQV